ncbi:MAG: leucine-rich repeat domain-containing protein [Lachnospiraceae bacterium]|nr:leucine-rich repeat domain-containing protein [Lachnospiraceae bacterium]
MRARKAFFAKVMAAAIALTSVLPSSLLVQAATIETVAEPVTGAEATSNWNTPLGPKVNEGGVETWKFVAGKGDGNDNTDYSTAGAAAVTYASKLDISAKMPTEMTPGDPDNENNLKFNYSVYTEKGSFEKMKFGIMVEYIDPTHWFYVGYDWYPHENPDGTPNSGWATNYPTHGHWYCEYNLGSGKKWPNIDGLIKNAAGTKGIDLEDNMFRNIEIEYVRDNAIQITVKEMGQVDPVTGAVTEDPNGRTVSVRLADKDYELQDNETLNQNVTRLEDNAFQTLASYQPTKADGKDYGRYMGFKISNGSTMNIQNVTSNYKNLAGDLQPIAFEDFGWKWVKNYDTLNIPQANRPSLSMGFTAGGRNYMILDAATSQTPVTDYLTNVTDFGYGEISADLRSDISGKEPDEATTPDDGNDTNTGSSTDPTTPVAQAAEDAEKMTPAAPFYLSARYDTETGEDVAVGWNGENWEYRVGDTTEELTKVPLKAELKKDYRIKMAIDYNSQKLSASVAPVVEGAVGEETVLLGMTDVTPTPAGMTNPAPVSDDIAAGSIAVTTGKKSILYVRNLSYTKKSYAPATDLANTYNDVAGSTKSNLAGNNADYKYFTEPWTAFAGEMAAVKAVIDKITPISPSDATEAEAKATAAWNALKTNVVVESNAYTTFYTTYDGVKNISEQGAYLDTDGSWTAFDTARKAAKTLVDGIGTKGYANEAALQTEIDDIDLATKFAALKKPATDEEKSGLQAEINAAADFFAKENKDYYDATEWETYEAAYNAAKELLENASATITDKDIAAKLEALEAAKTLTPAEATNDDIDDYNGKIAAIESAVSGNFTETDDYKAALAAAKALGADDATPNKKELAEALAALKAEQEKLTPISKGPEGPGGGDDKKEPVLTPNQQVTDATAPGMTFTVTDTANKTVALTEATVSGAKVTVPATVKTADGIECKVVAIAANAFTAGNSAKMTQITVGDNIETINTNAFNGCKKLKTIIIGANVKSIAKNAFNNCKKIQTVTFKGAKLPSMKKNSFNKVKTKASKIVVKVNKSLIKKASQKKALAKKFKKFGLKVSQNKIKKA